MPCHSTRSPRVYSLAVIDLGCTVCRPKPACGAAFYAFIKVPATAAGSATAFVERAIERNVLLIPGSVFSRRDTHVRLSYAVNDQALADGLAVLGELMTSSM